MACVGIGCSLSGLGFLRLANEGAVTAQLCTSHGAGLHTCHVGSLQTITDSLHGLLRAWGLPGGFALMNWTTAVHIYDRNGKTNVSTPEWLSWIQPHGAHKCIWPSALTAGWLPSQSKACSAVGMPDLCCRQVTILDLVLGLRPSPLPLKGRLQKRYNIRPASV